MGKKVKELPKIMDLPSKAPKPKKDDVPHWKVWKWALRNPGTPWKRT